MRYLKICFNLNKKDNQKGEYAMKATQQLKDEHQGIKIVFRILEKEKI